MPQHIPYVSISCATTTTTILAQGHLARGCWFRKPKAEDLKLALSHCLFPGILHRPKTRRRAFPSASLVLPAVTPWLRGMSGDPCLAASTHSVLSRHLLFLRARLEAIEAEQRRRAAATRQAKLDRLWARSRSVQTDVSWVHTKMAVKASGDWAPVTAGPWAPRQDRSRSPRFRGSMSQSAALGP